MSSVAVIGPDGAGKTTVARRLAAEPDLDVRYLYMGVSLASSNVSLPTTRLASRVKAAIPRSAGGGSPGGGSPGDGSPAGGADGRGEERNAPTERARGPWWNLRGGRLWATGRLLNRVAEEWYRQLLAWSYELRGSVVVYDRHYLFDFRGSDIAHRNRTASKRIHRWLLDRLYPRPDLVLCLDAPGEVLFARKGEKSPEVLEARRQAFLRQGEGMEEFVRVDAARPLEEVYAEVYRHVQTLRGEDEASGPAAVDPGSPGRSR